MAGLKVSKSTGRVITGSTLLLVLAFFVAGMMFYAPHAQDAVGESSRTQIRSSTAVVQATPTVKIEFSKTSKVELQKDVHIAAHSKVSSEVVQQLINHPIHLLSVDQRRNMSLEDHFVYLSEQSECENVPIFTSMANVFSDMYWQL